MSRPLAFTRAMRLVHRNDFARVFRSGRRARGAVVVVVVLENGSAHSRLGLSVGRAIWKSAVKRNRVRRIFREAFRLAYPDLPRGIDVIMIPAAPKLAPDLAATRSELEKLVARALALDRNRAPRGGTRERSSRTAREGSPRADRGNAARASESDDAAPASARSSRERAARSSDPLAIDRSPAP